jgi:hypothetical protein
MGGVPAFFSFIERYGTHIIVGVTIGGKDVVYVRQHQSSPSTVAEVQKLMHSVADRRFLGQADGHRERTGKEKVISSLQCYASICLFGRLIVAHKAPGITAKLHS